ncbi:MAG: hypothetical protein JXR76_11495 [Deltaproteobacteria bacterium]|nr:hypothetical protein [Deltaproteobacteria bacterium]
MKTVKWKPLTICRSVAIVPALLLCGCFNFDIPAAETESDDTQIESDNTEVKETDSDIETETYHNRDSDSRDTSETDDDMVPTDSAADSDSLWDTDGDTDSTLDSATTHELDTTSETDEEDTSGTDMLPDTDTPVDTDTGLPEMDTGTATDIGGFNSRPPVYPTLYEGGGAGGVSVTGDLKNPAPSIGEECNYGKTSVYNFAAINAHQRDKDWLGQWNDGQICGECVKVNAETRDGFKETVVRITGMCADGACGIRLGGRPASEVMEAGSGNYWGRWEFVPCIDYVGMVSDGPTSIYIMEGSSYDSGAEIQIRNPPAAVQSIEWEMGSISGTLRKSQKAKNYFEVAQEIRQTNNYVTLTIYCNFGITITHTLPGITLTEEKQSIVLTVPKQALTD